jgi:hypothetical protein
MAIDTAEKRYASLTFGHCLNAGTRIPSGTSTAARRGAALGLYYIESAAVDYLNPQPRRLIGTLSGLSLNGTSTTQSRLVGTSPTSRTIEGPMR